MSINTKGYALRGKRVWVAGHNGLVGSALVRRLADEDCEVLTVPKERCDLRSADSVERWMKAHRPDAIFMAAAKVGGIFANDNHPASFLYENLLIETNVIEAARKFETEKLLFLGSACIYPRTISTPIPESALLTGTLEPTNQWYAIAKIAGIKLCQAYRRQYGCDFISAMPNNLYGPFDRFDVTLGHVIPSLMAKVHIAKQRMDKGVEVWGSGTPLREFLYVDDAADGLVFIMKNYSSEEIINLGSGHEISIDGLIGMICDVVGYTGRIYHNLGRPDGVMRKLVDTTKLQTLGWTPRTPLREGLDQTYRWYRTHPCSSLRESPRARA